jgi:hypothetical protein
VLTRGRVLASAVAAVGLAGLLLLSWTPPAAPQPADHGPAPVRGVVASAPAVANPDNLGGDYWLPPVGDAAGFVIYLKIEARLTYAEARDFMAVCNQILSQVGYYYLTTVRPPGKMTRYGVVQVMEESTILPGGGEESTLPYPVWLQTGRGLTGDDAVLVRWKRSAGALAPHYTAQTACHGMCHAAMLTMAAGHRNEEGALRNMYAAPSRVWLNGAERPDLRGGFVKGKTIGY